MVGVVVAKDADFADPFLAARARQLGDQAAVDARTLRELEKALRESDLSEDEEHRELENLQKLTDRYIEAVDSRADRKEAEILEV